MSESYENRAESVLAPPPAVRPGFDPAQITRPDPSLLTYYAIVSALGNVAFPLIFVPLYFRYITLRYRFDESGISVSRGILFRREVQITYRRIQDIHVRRNILQRWMGLATVEVQTASGSSSAEVTIEGILQPDELRDFLYSKMRGAHEDEREHAAQHVASGDGAPTGDDVLRLLQEIRDLLHQLNQNRAHARGAHDD